MALELRQSLKLSQQLVMTPQLQQAIKLLQLSRLELQQAVREELEVNPALEESSEETSEETAEEEAPAAASTPPTPEKGPTPKATGCEQVREGRGAAQKRTAAANRSVGRCCLHTTADLVC